MRCLIALLLLAPSQEYEAAATSKVTDAPPPAGAQRVLTKGDVEQMTALLKHLYPDVALQGVEVLFWGGDYSGDAAPALRRQAGKLLEKAGWAYAEKEHKVEDQVVLLVSASRDARRVYGIWMATKEAALLVWAKSGGGAAEFGNVLYAVPKGWKAEVAADAVTLTPGDLLPQEKLYVLLLAGKEFKGDLKQSAPTLWTEACAAFNVDGAKLDGTVDVVRSLKGWDYFRHSSEVRSGENRLFLHVTFIQVGGRLERAACLTNYTNALYKETPWDSPRYRDAFDAFVFGLKFKNHAEPALAEGSLKGEGIVGVWQGLSMGFSATPNRLESKPYTAAFYTNGQVFFAAKLQTFLFEGASPALAREVTPRSWGTYTFDKGSGTIKMSYVEIPMELRGESLVLTTHKTPHKFMRLPRVDGTRLEGTYAFQEWQGKVPKITFSADGKFKDEGALGVLEHSTYKVSYTTAQPGEGTYEVKNWTILFHYGDGREFTAAFLGLTYKAGDLKPAELTLGFNHDTLKRQ